MSVSLQTNPSCAGTIRIQVNHLFRFMRGCFYRGLPVCRGEFFLKKLAGYERRWGLEKDGFTKEGFFGILQKYILVGVPAGSFYELVAGDGRVGSLGVWLEGSGGGWRVEAWEHRPHPLAAYRTNRPGMEIHGSRLLSWSDKERKANLRGITSRGSHESSAICREIRGGRIRPGFVGIWNPTRRPVWVHRLGRAGYRLEMVYERMEFYRDRR